MRHFKVEHQFDFWHTSREFDFLREQYDINPIVNQAVDKIEVEKIYISSLVRTKLTALSVGYLEQDLEVTPLLNEVPNRSFHGFCHSTAHISMESDGQIAMAFWN